MKPFLSIQNQKTITTTVITLRLDYCNSLYSGVSQCALACLQVVQNDAARLITGIKKRENISPALMSLHWLTVKYNITLKIILYVFKAPQYIIELISPYYNTWCLRSANLLLLTVLSFRLLRKGDQAFVVAEDLEQYSYLDQRLLFHNSSY